MRIGLLLPRLGDLDTVDVAVRAEELGYEDVWLGELWGGSSVVTLTRIAERTNEVGFGPAILNVYSRTPAVLAMTAASLQDVSDGRFTLGLGVSTEKAIEDLHSMDFDRPVRRSHETIELTREFLEGEGRVDYEGECFDVQDFPALDTEVPIYHAALGEANRRVVARLADGWIPHNIPFSAIDEAYDYICEHAEKAGRSGSDITVAPYLPAVAHEDESRARDAIRGHVAYYVGSGEGYRNAVASVYPEEAEAVAEAWAAGDRSEAADRVTAEMVDDLGVAGTPAAARARLREIGEETCIERPMLAVPQQADDDLVESTMEALAPGP